MKCEDAQKSLSLLIDDDLTENERSDLAAHVTECPKCHAVLRELTATVKHLRAIPGEPPPPWLKAAIMASVRAEGRSTRSLWQRLFCPVYIKVPLEAVAVAATVVLVLQLYKTDTDMQKQAYVPAGQERAAKDAPSVAPEKPKSEGRYERPSIKPQEKAPAPAPMPSPATPRSERPAQQQMQAKPSVPNESVQDEGYHRLAETAPGQPEATPSPDTTAGLQRPAAPAKAMAPEPAREQLREADAIESSSSADNRYIELAYMIKKQALRRKAEAITRRTYEDDTLTRNLTRDDMPVLVRMLSDDDQLVADEAERLLVSFGTVALPLLINASGSPDSRVAERAARAVLSIRKNQP